jgi:hypothetical protein
MQLFIEPATEQFNLNRTVGSSAEWAIGEHSADQFECSVTLLIAAGCHRRREQFLTSGCPRDVGS